MAVETCKGGEGGLHSNFSEATNAVEHCTKSNKKPNRVAKRSIEGNTVTVRSSSYRVF